MNAIAFNPSIGPKIAMKKGKAIVAVPKTGKVRMKMFLIVLCNLNILTMMKPRNINPMFTEKPANGSKAISLEN